MADLDFQEHPIDFQEDSNQESDPGALKTGAAGVLSGLTFGAGKHGIAGIQAAKDAATGNTNSLQDLYDRYKQHLADQVAMEKKGAELHPIVHYGGEIAGAIASPVAGALKGAGLIGEAAEGAGVLGKVANAAKTGAVLGGTAAAIGTNNPLPEQLSTQGAGDVAKGAVGGGLLGGALGTAGAAVDKVGGMADEAIQNLSEKDIPFISNAAKRYILGRPQGESVDLFDAKKLADEVSKSATEAGERGLGSQITQLSDKISQVMQKAEESGKSADFTPLMDHVKDLKQQAETVQNPDTKEQLNHLITYIEDRITPSTAEAAAVPEGMPSPTAENTGEVDMNTPAAKATPSDALQLEKDLGSMVSGGKDFTMTPSLNAAKTADKLATSAVDDATKSAAFPEGYGPLRTQYNAFQEAAKNLNLPASTPSEFYTKTADGGAVFNPDVAKALENTVRKSITDPHTAANMNIGFDWLKKAGVENVDELKDSMMKAVQNDELGVNPPALKSIISPIGSIAYKAAKYATAAPNIIGRSVGTIDQGLQKAGQGIQNVAAGTGADTTIGSNAINMAKYVAGQAEPNAGAASMPANPKMEDSSSVVAPQEERDYLGNKFNPDAKKTPANFSKNLYSANPEQLQNVVRILHSGKYSNYADALGAALKVGDQQKINGVLFVLASNPNTRELLQGPVPVETSNIRHADQLTTMGNGPR